MHFETQFTVAGAPDAVAQYFADVPLMASFLPGASVEAPGADGSYPATLVASFGPKKIAFKGSLKNTVDTEALSGALIGQAAADVRGARMAVSMSYRLAPADGGRQTQVLLSSDAQLTGVLAEFAKAGGAIVAEALIAEFARRFSSHVQAITAGMPSPQPTASAASLSIGTVLRALWSRWLRGVRSVFSHSA